MPHTDRTPRPDSSVIETPTDTRLPPLGRGKTKASRSSSKIERPSDLSITSQLARLPHDYTPAPLPPSPASEREGWFEQVATNPAPDVPQLFSDIGSSPGSRPGVTFTPIPSSRPAELTSPLAKLIQERPRAVPLLIATTFLVVGMVFGALIAGPGEKASGVAADADPAACVCPE